MKLQGYIDESYNDRFFTLSCILARPKEWMWIESNWKKILRQKNSELKRAGRMQISRYHASDCSNRKGEFKEWTVEEQITFVRQLLVIFNKHMTYVVAYTLPIADFKDIFLSPVEDPLPAMCRFLTGFLMHQTVDDIRTQGRLNEIKQVSIDLIHDRSPYDQSYRESFDSCKSDTTFSDRGIFKSIAPNGWENCIPLQPADLLAYETLKDVQNRADGRERRKSLTSILEGGKFGGRSKLFDRSNLQLLKLTIEANAAGEPMP